MKASRTILCVDADSFGLEVRKLVLESFGYKVLSATSGSGALTHFVRRRVDAVILDYAVEGMRGDELARKLKTLRPRTPVMMLSNMVYPPQSALPYIDGFATKGDSPQSLMATIEGMLRRPRERERRAQRLIVAGGLAVTGLIWLMTRPVEETKPKRMNVAEKLPPKAVKTERRTHRSAHA